MRLFKKIILICAAFFAASALFPDMPLKRLAENFESPPDEYKPYVWWHWMGSLYSKEGIRKDLEAMKESGIGGATIFNIAEAVQESHTHIENLPWPEKTYRSEAYWDCLKFAAAEAKRLGLKIGLQNTPGYATTGGPWITEERGMQQLVYSRAELSGGKTVNIVLETPELPVYNGWGTFQTRASYYKDIAVIALPLNAEGIEKALDISTCMDAKGRLKWKAPNGSWQIFRIGHAPTMANPHPLPKDLMGKAFEVDKMSEEQNIYHWKNVLEPLRQHLGEFIGDTFTHILIDSYEAGNQDWTPNFREEFEKQKGYDPLPWLALKFSNQKAESLQNFSKDYNSVINRLFIDKGWMTAKKMIAEAGLQFFWEPYSGQFDTYESVSLADLPMGEFWTHSNGHISRTIVDAAKKYKKNIVGAEAFTGTPQNSKYTEDPAFLKASADGSFISGANLLFLHHWVHQPFNEKYQPGMGMGWWGTHFGRNQTWAKQARAFFAYLARCQMLLQQGEFKKSEHNILHRESEYANILFIINPLKSVARREITLPISEATPELWDAENGTISSAADWSNDGSNIKLNLELGVDKSIFVILPKTPNKPYDALKTPFRKTEDKSVEVLSGEWDVLFNPKLGKAFQIKMKNLQDFSASDDVRIKYFAGTAAYRKSINIKASDLAKNKRIVIDLGELHDIAELAVNGKNLGVLWHPPYKKDITEFLKAGKNTVEIHLTNNWANCLIGDEQYAPDFEWGCDRGADVGRSMKAFPDWFIKGKTRLSAERKTFSIWHYYRKDSKLEPAGLIGPVKIILQTATPQLN